MAIRIRSLRKCVDDNGLKALVHGLAGSGKTVLCATTGAPTLIISSEKGLLSIRDAPTYIKAVEIKSLVELDEVYDYLNDSADSPDFEWVCLDSISDIAEAVLANEKAKNKDPRAAYGNLQDEVLKTLRKFRDLPHYNVLMTCKQERVSNDGVNLFIPMMPGAKLSQQIPYLFDEVFALRVEKDEEGTEYRVLQTSRDVRFEAKDRSGVLEMFEPPNMKKILAKVKSGMEPGSTHVADEEETQHEVKVNIEVVEEVVEGETQELAQEAQEEKPAKKSKKLKEEAEVAADE